MTDQPTPEECAKIFDGAVASSHSAYLSEELLITAARHLHDYAKMKASLEDACALYCRWYDTGTPRMDGAAMAYELVSAIRQTLRLSTPTEAAKK